VVVGGAPFTAATWIIAVVRFAPDRDPMRRRSISQWDGPAALDRRLVVSGSGWRAHRELKEPEICSGPAKTAIVTSTIVVGIDKNNRALPKWELSGRIHVCASRKIATSWNILCAFLVSTQGSRQGRSSPRSPCALPRRNAVGIKNLSARRVVVQPCALPDSRRHAHRHTPFQVEPCGPWRAIT
jgi:hypothetical protein